MLVSGVIGHEAALRLEYWVWFYRICYDTTVMKVESRTATEGMRLDEAGGITMASMWVEL